MYHQILSIYYLANAGVYLETDLHGILIDGLFDSHDGFDALPWELESAIMEKRPPFERLDTLVFTHMHSDHYSSDKVSSFKRRYPDTLINLPAETDSDNPLPGLFYPEPSVPSLYSLTVRHLLEKEKQGPNRVLLFYHNNVNLFFSGDADPVFLNKVLRNEDLPKIHMAFVNPFFLSLTPGRRLLKEISPEQILVYHMPVQAEDTLRYHEILKRGMERSQNLPVLALTRFMLRIF